MKELFDIEDKVVVITGGLGQLGREFARALADRGAKTAIFDNRVKKERLDGKYLFMPVDVRQKRSIESALRKMESRWGIPQGLINAAALDAPPGEKAKGSSPFENYPEKVWEEVLDVNLKGVFLCCQVIGDRMARRGGGSIVNIGSIYGMVSPDQRIYQNQNKKSRKFLKPVAYSVSKSGLLNLTRYLATYWAGRNVRVNTLTLGGVLNHQSQKFIKNYSARVPLGRMAREEEYNGAIIFLLSDASSYMTGSNFVIDGGWTAW